MAEDQGRSYRHSSALFFLFNDGKDVRGYSAPVPDLSEDRVSLTFSKPYDLGTSYSFGELVSPVAAEPVFDSQALNVIYATNTKHSDKEGKAMPLVHSDGSPTQYIVDGNPGDRSAISVWTIGRHVSRDKVEHTKLRGISKDAQPSVLVEGGVVSASVLEYYPKASYYSDFRVAQQQKDGKYTELSIQEDSGGLRGGKSKLFAGTLPRMEYIYTMVPQNPDETGWFNMHTMRTSNFEKLGSAKDFSWQTSTFYPQFELPILPAHAFSEDRVAQTPRMLLFCWREDYSAIFATSIQLRADGSFADRNGTEVESTGLVLIDPEVPEPGRDRDDADEYPGPHASRGGNHNLSAFVFERDLLLLWTTNEGMGGMMGALNEDGTVPEDWEWSTVNVSFENGAPTGDASKYSFKGVTVSKDFIS